MNREQKRRLTDNGDALLGVLRDVMPRCTVKQRERISFLLDVIEGRPAGKLFAPPASPKEKSTIFRKSDVGTIEAFIERFKDVEPLGIDLVYYYHAVLDWSNTKSGVHRTADGWVSTARGFMRRDKDKNKLHVLNATEHAHHDEELAFLKKGY